MLLPPCIEFRNNPHFEDGKRYSTGGQGMGLRGRQNGTVSYYPEERSRRSLKTVGNCLPDKTVVSYRAYGKQSDMRKVRILLEPISWTSDCTIQSHKTSERWFLISLYCLLRMHGMPSATESMQLVRPPSSSTVPRGPFGHPPLPPTAVKQPDRYETRKGYDASIV